MPFPGWLKLGDLLNCMGVIGFADFFRRLLTRQLTPEFTRWRLE
jgi:hypothetical protein